MPRLPVSTSPHVGGELHDQRAVEAHLDARGLVDLRGGAVAHHRQHRVDRHHAADEEGDGEQAEEGEQHHDDEAAEARARRAGPRRRARRRAASGMSGSKAMRRIPSGRNRPRRRIPLGEYRRLCLNGEQSAVRSDGQARRAGAGADHPGGATDATSSIRPAGLGPGPAARRRRRRWPRPPRACWWWRRTSTTSSPSTRRRPTSSPPASCVTNIYDRLVQYDAEDPTVLAPGLATEWTEDPAAKTITFTLRDGAKFHSGNPVRAEDVVFSFARVVKLNLTPAFILTQLGWTPENIAEMVTADGNKVTVKYEGDFSPAFVMNVLASRPASVVDEADGHGERGERRHGQRLDERPFRRLGAVLAAGLPPGGAGAADRLPRLLQGRAQGRQRHHPPRGRIRDPAAPAAAGRRGHGQEPDPRPDRRPAGRRRSRSRSSRRPPCTSSPSTRRSRRCSPRRSGRRRATSSTTRA